MTAVYQHLGLTPKGVDMWCGNNQTLHLIQWLEDIGFNKFLHLVPSNTVSHVVHVASNTAWKFHHANNWTEVEIQPTLDKCIIYQYYSKIVYHIWCVSVILLHWFNLKCLQYIYLLNKDKGNKYSLS